MTEHRAESIFWAKWWARGSAHCVARREKGFSYWSQSLVLQRWEGRMTPHCLVSVCKEGSSCHHLEQHFCLTEDWRFVASTSIFFFMALSCTVSHRGKWWNRRSELISRHSGTWGRTTQPKIYGMSTTVLKKSRHYEMCHWLSAAATQVLHQMQELRQLPPALPNQVYHAS